MKDQFEPEPVPIFFALLVAFLTVIAILLPVEFLKLASGNQLQHFVPDVSVVVFTYFAAPAIWFSLVLDSQGNEVWNDMFHGLIFQVCFSIVLLIAFVCWHFARRNSREWVASYILGWTIFSFTPISLWLVLNLLSPLGACPDTSVIMTCASIRKIFVPIVVPILFALIGVVRWHMNRRT